VEDKALISFTVRDSGIGIPQDMIDSIFHPFEQIPAKGHKYTDGFGLGLPLVQKILKLFGAGITVHSEVGKGSAFSFEIGLQEVEMVGESNPEMMARGFAGQKALVVDDVRLNRVILVNLLHETGFIVDEAEDGKEALEMFEQSQEGTYNIILMDIQMPMMDGWESTAAIRSLPRLDAKTVPIVTVSANAFQEDIDKSLASGMNAHYAKPISMETVTEIVTKFCTPNDQ